MINLILAHKVFKSKPPILFDLGAAGDQKDDWNKILHRSYLYKLDANYNVKSSDNKNQIIINETIFNKKTKKHFYITNSIFCSSLLYPNYKQLNNWPFKDKFIIKRKIKVNTKSFKHIIKKYNIINIDWIKIDLQGIDLKIFKSIPINLRKNILMAEFEPGLYSFYKNEDKLSDIINFMEKEYLIEEFVFSSSIRSSYKFFKSFNFLQKKSLNLINKKSKFYTNVSFLKRNELLDKKDLRSILLMIVILILKKRYIEALEISVRNVHLDPIFNKIKKKILLKIKIGIFLYFLTIPYYFFKKIFF